MSPEEGAATETDATLLLAPEQKYANPRDHLGRTAVEFRRSCHKAAECRCPECRHPLVVRSGEKLSTHFAHAKGRANAGCRGAFETPWHFAAKIAASNREGWQREWSDGGWRYDACNQFTGQVFEAVHSLSDTYVEKQRHLSSTGRSAVWLFDSAADFTSRWSGCRLDVERAFVGILRCSEVMKPKAADLVDDLGRERCFLHYLGLSWKCVGRDSWQYCADAGGVSNLVCGEFGLNRLLIDMRASGKYDGQRVWFRDGELVSTSWQEITPLNLVLAVRAKYGTLYQTWLQAKRQRDAGRLHRDRRQFRNSTPHDLASRHAPICSLPSKGMSELQLAHAESIASAARGLSNVAGSGVRYYDGRSWNAIPGDHRPRCPALECDPVEVIDRGRRKFYCRKCGRFYCDGGAV
jgi:hypothetical protein